MFTSQLQPIPSDGDGQLDVSSIGRANGLHSEEEQLYIRNVLLAAEVLLQSGTVDGDLRRREETVDVIGRCKIALAPHKRLPPDVLRSIFHFCGEARIQFPLKHLPLLCRITHVCSAWRQLALETPALWNGISIALSSYSGQKQHDKILSSARQWFDRAQDMRGRSLFIRYDIVGNENVRPRLHYAWEKLLEFIAQYRLEALELAYPINHVALKLPDHVWPSIKHLHLKTMDNRRSTGQQLFSNFGKLSNLRHLEISGSCHLDDMDRVVPWHQLRTFEVDGNWEITPSSCLNMLRQSRLLEHCRVTLSSFTSTVNSTEENVVLANLDYFEARFEHGLAVALFLHPLVMPNITTFSLGGCRLDIPALIGIIQRSGGMRHIRHLEISYFSPTAVQDIGVLLELLPSLESISIASGRLSDNSIKRLSSGKLGPRLRSISVGTVHDTDQILSMAELRYQNATQSPDSEQIEDMPCPFKFISIRCHYMDFEESYRNRIKLLLKKCNTRIDVTQVDEEILSIDPSFYLSWLK
ncbi:hypothetical protein F5887DRAFT_1282072 [Amanita rubescens]|nr:hypothetical protein F5887DRAFT_1282072 [Amanita rubescens]